MEIERHENVSDNEGASVGTINDVLYEAEVAYSPDQPFGQTNRSESKNKTFFLPHAEPSNIGRESNFFRVDDKQVSRLHMVLKFHQHTGKLTVQAVGSNPILVNQGGTWAKLSRGDAKLALDSGDQISLLPNAHFFFITKRNFSIAGTKSKQSASSSASLSSSSSTSSRDKPKAPSSSSSSSTPSTKAKPKASPSNAAPSGNFRALLDTYVTRPQDHKDDYVTTPDDEDSKDVIVILDKYPKAKVHYLVMPNFLLGGFRKLTKEHLPLIEKMIKRSQALIKQVRKTYPDAQFRVGFHAVPSLNQLHMHVISQDFDSSALKNKKHWNSFTTAFFVDAQEFYDNLKRDGCIKYDEEAYEALLKEQMKCHRCKAPFTTLPQLKTHIKTCNKQN